MHIISILTAGSKPTYSCVAEKTEAQSSVHTARGPHSWAVLPSTHPSDVSLEVSWCDFLWSLKMQFCLQATPLSLSHSHSVGLLCLWLPSNCVRKPAPLHSLSWQLQFL